MSERIEVGGDVSGPNNPNQPNLEGVNEQEASSEGQAQQTPEEHAFEVPNKFIQEDGTVDVEAMARSYAELERMQSGMPQEGDQMSQDTELSEGAEGALVSQEDVQNYNEQLLQSGDLTDESYADLESRGLPRDLVQAYVEGQKALMNAHRASVLDSVGGEDAYAAMTQWADKNLSDAEIEAYDNAMASGDQNAIMMNIQGLHARYQQAEGRPNLIKGEVGAANASQGFRSWAEVTTAMKDNRYRNDPAYQEEVKQRLAVSNLK